MDSQNPTNLDALDQKITADNGGVFEGLLQPVHRIELTNNAPITTGATNSSPFGFATADQGDDLVATVNQLRAGLIALGLFIDTTANSD